MVVLWVSTNDKLSAPIVFGMRSLIDSKMIGDLGFRLMGGKLLLFMNHNLMVTIGYVVK